MFDAGVSAAAREATPFKRPENGVFQPGTGFKDFYFTETGDTSTASTLPGRYGAVFHLALKGVSRSTGTLTTTYVGNKLHTGFDNIQFATAKQLLVVEDAGDTLHAQRNALDSGYVLDLAGIVYGPPPVIRWLAEGRDPSATYDALTSPGYNDGDNEITGIHVSNGVPTTAWSGRRLWDPGTVVSLTSGSARWREERLKIEIPAKLLAFADRGDAWADWINRLPALAAGLVDEWGLRVDGPSKHGEAALVVPARTSEDRAAVLKIGWPHEEAEHEHLALRFWGGRGAVALLRADPHRSALLLERLHVTDLTTRPINQACEVIAGLYAELHVAASPEFRTLSSLCQRWTARLEAIRRHPGLPRRYVERAISLTRELGSDPATDGVLVHTDFHYENVLAAEREPWLAIDPKPLSGDPAFEIAPLLWNRWDEAVDTGDVRRALRERFETVVDVAGLDEERAKAWVIVRMLVNAMWEIEDPAPESDEMDGWLTDAITIAKAMDD